ncbi:hypothetical protein LJ655_10830 [Paraburkholderia sp. MMS20-SJTN17]|uniref:Secreted protein n=1 Tax=Paraburkholderia translucens TaxID=2886945 RepID=A0ABS8KC87_9BURK|nr:hypothetical protein [Paraburkholderia sp. MMS20-SJTN17]MCC8402380.1 hypothetical protein [Paraburkholderia sp. MMS20-SJTN17]
MSNGTVKQAAAAAIVLLSLNGLAQAQNNGCAAGTLKGSYGTAVSGPVTRKLPSNQRRSGIDEVTDTSRDASAATTSICLRSDEAFYRSYACTPVAQLKAHSFVGRTPNCGRPADSDHQVCVDA